MATEGQSDLAGFHQFVGEQLTDPNVKLSPEQALAAWRCHQEEIEAVRAGLADVEAGRTIPLDQFIHEFRQRHQISEDA